MKALSIIGIIVSLAGLLTGIYTLSEGHCYCSGSYDYSYGYYGSNSYTDDDVTVGATLFMLISLFFLIFSIIATVVSFRKKNPAVQPYAGFQQGNYNPYNQQANYGQGGYGNYQNPNYQNPNYQNPNYQNPNYQNPGNYPNPNNPPYPPASDNTNNYQQ